jgi:hypothetical protein
MRTRFGEVVTAVRTNFAWFGPSLPHSTVCAVLDFVNVSEEWMNFFRRVLEAPMKFMEDGKDAPVQIRKRGTPISGPPSDMLGETVLFCLDFAFNQGTDGARMYRLHDDIWFWGAETTCVKGWAIMTEFAELMGLNFNNEKTGSVNITRRARYKGSTLSSSLPKGDVRWGFLKLDSETGRFLIDQANVDTHIEELRRQLGACKSVFDWIQAWNVYGARFFTTHFGKPANCFGQAHVDMMLETSSRIQAKLFASTGRSVTSTLKRMISGSFGMDDIPEGYLYFPMSMGGLDIKRAFIDLYLIRDKISSDSDKYMNDFFAIEEGKYNAAKAAFDDGDNAKLAGQPFMPFAEYIHYRERASDDLHRAYMQLLKEPAQEEVTPMADVTALLGRHARSKLTPYYRWVIQLYATDMIARFGGLNVVDKGLLPTGKVNMFRESRFRWQG